jgi:hypothetical protein
MTEGNYPNLASKCAKNHINVFWVTDKPEVEKFGRGYLTVATFA